MTDPLTALTDINLDDLVSSFGWQHQPVLAGILRRIFQDPAHKFAGCIAGINEVLRRQGLLEGNWCLDKNESLSRGQGAEIDRVCKAYPHLNDNAFVEEHLDEWLR